MDPVDPLLLIREVFDYCRKEINSEAKKKPLKQMVSPQEVLLDVQFNYEKATILIITQIS